MRLTVRFAGLCLFVRPCTQSGSTLEKDKTADSVTVLLPRANGSATHPDGSPAKVHSPVLYSTTMLSSCPRSLDEPDGGFIYDLDGCEVEFDFGAGGSGVDVSGMQGIPEVHQFATDVKLIDASGQDPVISDSTTTRVVIRRGFINTCLSDPTRVRWVFTDSLSDYWKAYDRIAFLVDWVVEDAGDVAIRLTKKGEAVEIKLDSSTRNEAFLTIGNLCSTGDADGDCMIVTDEDFKWFYRLLETTTGGSWQGRLNGRELPAPEGRRKYGAPVDAAEEPSDRVVIRAITTPTCIPCEWCG
jgi:hypothetical protein